MRTTEFKVHTVYSKEDILQMEKVSTRKLRLRSLVITVAVFVLYLAIILWGVVKGTGHVSLFPEGTSRVLDIILLAALAVCIVVMIGLPYWKRNKILKSVPGGILKANYYFYEKTFQYGWGNTYSSIAYVDIEVFKDLPNSFFIEAKGLTYWVKKSDFQVGKSEAFLEFMKGKVRCKIS